MGEWLKKFSENVKKDKKRSLLMLVLVGILILVIAWPVSDKGGEHRIWGSRVLREQ